MATLLLAIIYMAFIGLGIPDSLFGAAWPAIYADFDLPVSYGSIMCFLSYFCTFCSSLISSKVINRFGTALVTAISTAMTAIALFCISFADSFWLLLVMAIPLGFGAGAVDASLNNYVALYYTAKQMSFLHCFYGVGVTISPYLLSFALVGKDGWHGGYRLLSFIQIGLALCLVFSYPLTDKARVMNHQLLQALPHHKHHRAYL